MDNLEKLAGKPKAKIGKELTAAEVGQEWAHKAASESGPMYMGKKGC